ncbi:hypothetical protein GCM10009665_56410 [Kitasatospora nipponensis]|uniref:Uncharacterized protein n=1 Tax=Kitasatospora nipponensis TaxID=258049 RepID=A0ABP4HCC7_9ACTN
MHVAGPGSARWRHGPTGGAPLRLARALGLEPDGHSPAALDPDLRVFLSDLVRPYGLDLDEEALRAGRGHAYAELGEALIRRLVAPHEPVDLLIQVFAAPDVQPGRAASVYLSSVCPGQPLAFALGDQGAAGTFSALRIAGEYLRSGDCRRALVLVAEQAELYYPRPPTAPWPDRHAVVGLLCEAGTRDDPGATAPPEPEARFRDHPDVPPERVAGLLTTELAELAEPAEPAGPTGPTGPVLLLGPGLAGVPAPPFAEVHRTRAGSPYTGLWAKLARGLPRWQRQRRSVLLADYDAPLRYLSLASWALAPCPQDAALKTAWPFVRDVHRSPDSRAPADPYLVMDQ